MRVRLYLRPEIVIWFGFTVTGTVVSALSLREISSGIGAIRRVALNRPHAEDILTMAEHNRISEVGRLVAQSLFLLTGVLASVSAPRLTFGRPRVVDRLLPWIIVAVEGILVGNSANEYLLSRRVLRRRINTQATTSVTDPTHARST